jgi:RES domain-containing protein
MIQAWRLVAAQWAASAFDGEGARLAGGRWNSRGIAMVYLASSLALATLELLVHIDYERALGSHMAIPVSFEDALVLKVADSDLGENWQAISQRSRTRAIGDAWATSHASVVIAVPSAVIPAEKNYLLNPKHPDFSKLTIGRPQPFRFDPRLYKR